MGAILRRAPHPLNKQALHRPDHKAHTWDVQDLTFTEEAGHLATSSELHVGVCYGLVVGYGDPSACISRHPVWSQILSV